MTTLGYIGTKLDLLIRQGATFGPHTLVITNPDGTPVDLTGSTFRAQMRKEYNDAAPINFDVAVTGANTVSLSMADDATAALGAGATLNDKASKYVWDMEWEDALGHVLPVFYGDVRIQREITRV